MNKAKHISLFTTYYFHEIESDDRSFYKIATSATPSEICIRSE